ncbi:MAG TPA: imidazoleglycerol-phosphate dehydratase HisB [Epsilonproteobacteria bacterium]|nr:imidazoleglycerol-phosphate dehydratase HisB [Campylobacterota bacterium]HHH37777.1 imidazoleglycerol-phosphate dehydratase HisB [Campylobacterota bacterium]
MIETVRETKETQISVKLNLYGKGIAKINTGVGFFDHMLEAFTKHAHIDMEVVCKGDTFIDDHHSVEDVGIVIGQALKKAIYPVQEIERFGNATVVMDEASVTCDIDLSNRGFLVFELPIEGKVGAFDVELVEEFFRALAFNMPLTLHLICSRGKNKHHIIEAAFKALAVSLRRAATPNKNAGIPSTKGVL